ncbi:PilZ domain-containing protein [Bradyrhizobium cenepequi]|uniref:PilZ domain-containing protein n=1 Tax=Bradyrhizobium cenepequi TaxID=2821403 RepID=UPI001CE3809F|nr:PilZ domain-containing protein [Bradyrhizobium cenepequi]MCA6112583.1 PilZ domain-containing protein [Bradyrhizobium cenepequi]
MVETRIAPRVRVMKAAKIDYGGDNYPCIIRDISTTGAALEFPILMRIPDRFTLIIPEDRLSLLCHVVWRKEYRVGVAFD